MAKSVGESAKQMVKLHQLRNAVVKEARKIEPELPHEDKYQGLRQALEDLDTFQKSR